MDPVECCAGEWPARDPNQRNHQVLFNTKGDLGAGSAAGATTRPSTGRSLRRSRLRWHPGPPRVGHARPNTDPLAWEGNSRPSTQAHPRGPVPARFCASLPRGHTPLPTSTATPPGSARSLLPRAVRRTDRQPRGIPPLSPWRLLCAPAGRFGPVVPGVTDSRHAEWGTRRLRCGLVRAIG